MFLTDFNTHEGILEQIKNYLSTTKPSFWTLKQLILAKAPIAEVQNQFLLRLEELKQLDDAEIKKNLENQAYKTQLQADEHQKQIDHIEHLKSKELEARFTQELNRIPEQISKLRADQQTVQGQIDIYSIPSVVLSQYPMSNGQVAPMATLTRPTQSLNRLKNIVHKLEVTIQILHEKKRVLESKLDGLAADEEHRQERETERLARADARIRFQKKGKEFESTLSLKKQRQLMQAVEQHRMALEKRMQHIIYESKLIHYAVFIAEIPSCLKLSETENEAIMSLIKLMNAHLSYEHELVPLQQQLTQKNQTIKELIHKLERMQEQLKQLNTQSPQLTKTVERLVNNNIECSSSLETYYPLRRNLGNSALLLFGLCCLLSIPLILTLSGTIPLILAPALMYSLVATPPGLLLLATIATSIAALIFSFKIKASFNFIVLNSQQIDASKKQSDMNGEQAIVLQTITIPNTEAQIKKEEAVREKIAAAIQKNQDNSALSLKQAKEITPVLPVLPFFQTQGVNSSSDDAFRFQETARAQ